MKTQRKFAAFCLSISCCALITATSVSVGQQPGVVRLTSGQESFNAPAPVPPASGEDNAPTTAPDSAQNLAPAPQPQPDYSLPPAGGNEYGYEPVYSQSMPMQQGGSEFYPQQEGYPQQPDYQPYFEQSAGVTESPVIGRRPYDNPLFGPQLMFESNIGEGLGYGESYHRLNARIPYHVVPGNSVLAADLSASVSDNNRNLYNLGAYWRNYDAMRNRIFGWNAYWDMDDGRGNKQWNRLGFGMESLGKYIDFRMNGYVVQGDDSVLLTDELIGNLVQTGNTVTRTRNQNRDNAYSGLDFETGGPLPLLGRRGINAYAGAYWLDNDFGYETVGFSARVQALVTESATVDFRFTNDDTFGTNSYVSVSYSIPNYGERRIFEPKCVRDRLADPVYRSNRVHSNIDNVNVAEAIINAKTGVAWNINYVDPNATLAGLGTFESPWNTLQTAVNNNNAAVDIIQIAPRADDTGTNLTATGGIDLFDCQALITSTKDYILFSDAGQDFIIPGTATASGLGPLISDPAMVAGGSVIRLGNGNTVYGLRIDSSNAAGTVFGNGITNPLPITDARIVCNTFTNFVSAVNIQDGSGTIVFDQNSVDGLAGVSEQGLVLTTGNGSMTELLVRNNVVDDSSLRGISVTAAPGATINAADPNGVTNASGQATGIVNNRVTNGGEGIEVIGLAGSTINAIVQDNTSSGNTLNGFLARTDAGTFNLASMANNVFGGEDLNGNGIIDGNEDVNGNGVLDVTEDTNGNGVLDIGEDTNGNGFLDLAEDLNGNGVIDTGEDLNGDGVLAAGNGANGAFLHYLNGGQFFAFSEDVNEDKNFNGLLDPGEDLNFNGSLDVADGLLSAGEDLNGNGLLDRGIVSNLFANNTTSGLCIFGEGSGDGLFVIGGPATALGNQIVSNVNAGLAVDLSGTATGQIDSMFNTIENTGGTGVFTTSVNALFTGSGDTLTANYTLTNLSAVADITAFTWDLNLPAGTADWEFDTTQLAPAVRIPGNNFTPLNGSEITTGLTTVNGIGTPPFDDSNGLQTLLDTTGNQLLTLGFTSDPVGAAGFDANETLGWDLDIDPNNLTPDVLPDNTVNANELVGTVASVTFRDDFTGTGVQSQRTITSVLSASATDPLAFEAQFNQTFRSATFNPSPTVIGNGVQVSATDSSKLISFNSINDSISLNKGDGLSIVASNNATVDALTIQGATIEQNNGRGINLVARDNAVINASNTIGGFDLATGGLNVIGTSATAFSEGNSIQNNISDGIRVLAADGGTVTGRIINNAISSNGGNGIALQIENGGTLDFGRVNNAGTLLGPQVISLNNIQNNGDAGIRLVSNVSAADQAQLDAVIRNNQLSNNAGGGIVSEMTGPNMLGLTNNLVNLTVGGTTAEANTIAGNGNVGVGFSVAGNGKGNFNLSNSTITGTTDGPDLLTDGDAINLRRADSSLLTATIDNVTATGNAGDGLDVDVQGNDKNDPNQPMSGTINTVTWTNNNFSSNGQNGARFRVRGDAQLIADGSINTVSNNGANGIEISTSETASFGDPTDGLPPGRRVVLDGITATGNAVDGIQINATENSRVLTEITSNLVPGSTNAHAALNTTGNTTISGNGSDGIHITTTGGSSDILITSGTGTTTISGNGITNGGNGIRWDSSGNSDGTVLVTKTSISGNLSGISEDVNGNGVLDAGEDLNNNGDIDVADGDGVQYNVTGVATSTLVVGGVGEGNLIQSNGDDGIAITATNTTGTFARPIVTILENTIGGENNGIAVGNAGDGLSMNIFGQSLVGTGNLLGTAGVQGNGPIVQLTVQDNTITNSGQRGVNLLLHGAAGERDRENGAALVDPVRIVMTGNNISSNGTEGIYFRGDSDTLQNRVVSLLNPPDGMGGFIDNTNFDPNRIEFTSLNIGSVNANTAYQSPYLNLRTVQNTFLTLTDNAVQNNGVGTVTGEGVFIEVGTGSYLAVDVRNNQFGGNLEEDFHTESFLSAGETALSTDVDDALFDRVPLDDTAQLDLRFSNNSGNQIAVTATGATYTQFDLEKFPFAGATRDAFLFQVDDGMNLDNPNNTFINFGITQPISSAFATGGYNLRAAADPMFPNIGFAPFLP